MPQSTSAITRWESYLQNFGTSLLTELTATEDKDVRLRRVELGLMASFLCEVAVHENKYGSIGISKTVEEGLRVRQNVLERDSKERHAGELLGLLSVAESVGRAAVPVITDDMHRDLTMLMYFEEAGDPIDVARTPLPTQEALMQNGLAYHTHSGLRVGNMAVKALEVKMTRNVMDALVVDSDADAAAIFSTGYTPE